MAIISIDIDGYNNRLEHLQKKSAWAEKVAKTLSADDSPVSKLAKTRRGNTAKPNAEQNVDKVFAATIGEEIKRTKASIKRFAS